MFEFIALIFFLFLSITLINKSIFGFTFGVRKWRYIAVSSLRSSISQFRMELLEGLMSKLTLGPTEYGMGSAHMVNITHVNHPHSIFVCPIKYDRYLKVLQSYESREPLKDAKISQLVIYKSKEKKSYIRGKIANIRGDGNNKKCDLFAIDYGCFEKDVPIEEIHKRTYPVSVPALALHCQLVDCKPIGSTTWNEKAIDTLKFFITREPAKIIIRGTTADTYIVEMFNTGPDDISTLMAYCECSTLGYDSNMVSRFTTPAMEVRYLKYKELKKGQVEIVRFQCGLSSRPSPYEDFFVAQINDFKQYKVEQDNFSSFTSQQKQEMTQDEVQVGKAIAVWDFRYLKYERAIVKEVNSTNNKIRVHHVDSGRTDVVGLGSLKPLQERFYRNPAVAIYCRIDETQKWDPKINKFFYPGYEFQITVKEVGDKFIVPYVVTISSLEKK